MTQTLTTERQQFEQWWHEEYCHLEGSSEAAFVKHVAWEAMKKARELLANREAQPVEVTDEMALAFHRALNDGGIGESDLEEIKVGLRGALCNITAPPAPAVPECFHRLLKHAYGMTMGHDWNKGTMAGHHRQKLCQAVEDCRAAMLAASENALSAPVKKFIPILSGGSTVNGTEPFPAALTCEEAAALDGTIFLTHLKPGGMVQVYAAVGKDDDRELIAFNPKDFKFTAPEGGN